MELLRVVRSRAVVSAGCVLLLAGGVLRPVSGCLVQQYCFSNEDCEAGLACLSKTGQCVEGQCQTTGDCQPDHACHARICVPRQVGPLVCPAEMVSIDNVFCMDRYEASRPDASATGPGRDGSRATSRQGVVPWRVESNQEAETACVAAGKDLCTQSEWQGACEGPQVTQYPYGAAYDPLICNGIDAFCDCGPGTRCPHQIVCPFAGCHQTCGSAFRLLPTGSNSRCSTPHGVFDLAGNLWEHVKHGDQTRVRGGGFNDANPQQVQACDFNPGTWAPEAVGFRCCTRPAS